VKENDMINGTKYITIEAEYLINLTYKYENFKALQDSREK